MSDITQGFEEQKFGLQGVEEAAGYVPMKPADPVVSTKELQGEEFETQREGFLRGAAEILKGREQRSLDVEGRSVDVERFYQTMGGENAGERKPPNEVVSIDQASHDITQARAADRMAAKTAEDLEVQRLIDSLRAGETEQQAPQPQLQQQTLPEQQPTNLDQLHQRAADVERELEAVTRQSLRDNPWLIAAVEDEVQKRTAPALQAQEQYQRAIVQNGLAAYASILSQFPELESVPPDQLQTAIGVIGKNDPNRANAIVAHVNRTSGLMNQAKQVWQEQVAAQQRQAHAAAAQYQQQFNSWSQAQDNAFEKWAQQQVPAHEYQAIQDEVISSLKADGWTEAQLAQAWQSQPSLRSFSAQRQMFDAARYRLAQKGAKAKVSRPVPSVQAPGSPVERMPDQDQYLRQLDDRLSETLSIKDATKLVVARREAKARRR